MSYGIMQNKNIILVGIVALSFMNDGGGIGVEAVAAGRRRRRSIYNVRPCGPGQRAIWTPSKKMVSSCVSCEEGKYRGDTQHALEECSICKGGRHSSDDLSYCIGDICKAGYFGIKGTVECNICAAGKYSDMNGLFACKECESGRYVAAEGSNTCKGEMCPAGKWGTSGASSETDTRVCHTCRAGQFSHAGYSRCIACPKGKFSGENAGYCIDHKKCSLNSYPDVEPTTDSDVVSCARCIYSSDIVYAGFIFALTIAIVNILLFLYNRSKYCHAMFFVISPTLWALFMNMCKSKPGNVAAIISIAMNLLCTLPSYSALKYKYIEISEKRLNLKKIYSMNERKLPIKNNLVNESCDV